MKKTLSVFLLFALFTMIFSGFVIAEETTINLLCDSRSEFVEMEKYLSDFTSETGIKVNKVKIQETPLRAKTGLELSAPSTDIDVILMDFLFLRKYAKKDMLEPLDKYLDDSSVFDKKNFMKPFIDASSYKGNLYGMPLYQDCNVLVYRADLFKKYDLDVPETMEEFRECAKVINNKEDGVYGIAMRGQRGMGVNEWTWPTFLHGFGGQYYDKDMKPQFDKLTAINALEYYANLLADYGPEGVANYSYIEVQQDMMNGKAGMMIDSASLIPRLENMEKSKVKGKLGYAIVPGVVEQEPGFYSWELCIPKNSNDKKKAAAARFIEWITSPDIAVKLGWSAPNQALEQVYNIPAYSDYKQSRPLIDVMKDSLKLADPDYRPRIPEQAEVGTEVSIAISKAFSKSSSAKKAMKECNEKVYKILKKAGYYSQ